MGNARGFRQMRRIQVYIVIPPRLLLLDVAGPLEVLRRAKQAPAETGFEVHYVGPCSSLLTSISMTVTEIAPPPDKLPEGAMEVVAGDVEQVMMCGDRSSTSRSKADTAEEKTIVEWLRAVIRPSHKLILICSGAPLAVRAKLLDGHACTTHHSCCVDLAKLAPRARVIKNRIFVEDGDSFSSSGITAGIDLMLHIVSELIDQSCAMTVARYLVVCLRRSGADPQLSPWLEGRNHIHPAVHPVQDAIAGEPAKPWTLDTLAKMAGASNRRLSRLFRELAGMSITDYRNRLRVAPAKELLDQTRLDMETCGRALWLRFRSQLRCAWRRLYATGLRQATSSFISLNAKQAPPIAPKEI
jgi:transcriptional regulator GlxA family with amidase domain